MTTALLGLRAHTSIHAGAGQAIAVVDLPIQREAGSDWPCIFGSSMKGAMRNSAVDAGVPHSWINEVFGPDDSPQDHAGALAVTDARLLFLPVRSLTSHFKMVTCPAALNRFVRDLRWCGHTGDADKISVELKALSAGASSFVPITSPVLLEDVAVPVVHSTSSLPTLLGKFFPGDSAALLNAQGMVVQDDEFRFMVRRAVAVTPHIRLNSETKTPQTGALWFEETLAPETLLYTILRASPSRKPDSKLTSSDVLKETKSKLFAGALPFLRIGGNETVGMGWCMVHWTEPAAHPNGVGAVPVGVAGGSDGTH